VRLITIITAMFVFGSAVAGDPADGCTHRDRMVCDEDGNCDVLLTASKSPYHTQPSRVAPNAVIDPRGDQTGTRVFDVLRFVGVR